IRTGLCRLGIRVHIGVFVFQDTLILCGIERRIQNLRRIVDQLVIQGQTIGTNGFHGRTGLVRDRGAVGAQVVFLLADTAADAQNVAVIIQRSDGRLGAHFFVHTQINRIVVGVVVIS